MLSFFVFLCIFYSFFQSLKNDPQVSLILSTASFHFGIQYQLTDTLVKSSSFPLWKNHACQEILLCNVLILSCLGSFQFGTHLYYSLKSYVLLFCPWFISTTKDRRYQEYSILVWSFSIVKDRRYQKYLILCVVYFFSKIPSLC